MATAYRRLLDTLLPDGLAPFVARRRAKGMTWRAISRDVYAVTGEDVSDVTLAKWYREDHAEAAS